MTNQTTRLAAKAKMPTATMPTIWAPKLAPSLVSGTTSVPQMPATRWTGMAPTTSSIFSLSSSGTAKTTITPPMAPMTMARPGVGVSGSAVIDTRPASAPLSAMVRSIFL